MNVAYCRKNFVRLEIYQQQSIFMEVTETPSYPVRFHTHFQLKLLSDNTVESIDIADIRKYRLKYKLNCVFILMQMSVSSKGDKGEYLGICFNEFLQIFPTNA